MRSALLALTTTLLWSIPTDAHAQGVERVTRGAMVGVGMFVPTFTPTTAGTWATPTLRLGWAFPSGAARIRGFAGPLLVGGTLGAEVGSTPFGGVGTAWAPRGALDFGLVDIDGDLSIIATASAGARLILPLQGVNIEFQGMFGTTYLASLTSPGSPYTTNSNWPVAPSFEFGIDIAF